ncbi:MAG: hypothetical protein ACR2LK_15785 [Solirubrobacteraceae bacterium]
MARRKMTSAFALPPGAPSEVAAAHARHDALTIRAAEMHGEISDLRAAIEAGRRADAEAMRDAARSGKKMPDQPRKRERDAEAALSDAEARLGPLEEIADEAGLALLQTIEQHRDPWLGEREQHRDEARERFREALDAARTAAAELGAAVASTRWLGSYSADDQLRGASVFHGRGALRADDGVRGQRSVAELLAVIEGVLAPEPTSHRTAPTPAKREEQSPPQPAPTPGKRAKVRAA